MAGVSVEKRVGPTGDMLVGKSGDLMGESKVD